MAHLAKVPATEPDNLSSVPGTNMVGGENHIAQVVLWPQHIPQRKKKLLNIWVRGDNPQMHSDCARDRDNGYEVFIRKAFVAWVISTLIT